MTESGLPAWSQHYYAPPLQAAATKDVPALAHTDILPDDDAAAADDAEGDVKAWTLPRYWDVPETASANQPTP